MKTPGQLADELVSAHPVFAGARDSYKVIEVARVIREAVAEERERCARIAETCDECPCCEESIPKLIANRIRDDQNPKSEKTT